MGKIMVTGKAEKEYAPDQCNIDLEVEVERKTSVEASRVATEHCEQLLKCLQDLGLDISKIEIEQDSISKRSSYNSDERHYEAKKYLQVRTAADMVLINKIRGVIETGFEDVSFSTDFCVSNEQELRRSLLKDAISDSRAKAELLAESMGCRITGIDTANLSGDEDVYDLTDENAERFLCRRKDYGAGDILLLDQLTPSRVRLDAEVKIVWLLEESVSSKDSSGEQR